MKVYAMQFTSPEEIALFEKIRKCVLLLPDVDLGKDEKGQEIILSCHMLARAVAKVFNLRYKDGYLYPKYEHSWNIMSSGHVVDVYPVGILGGPILVEGRTGCSPARYHYVKAGSRFPGAPFSKNSFRRSVRRIAANLKKISIA